MTSLATSGWLHNIIVEYCMELRKMSAISATDVRSLSMTYCNDFYSFAERVSHQLVGFLFYNVITDGRAL